MADENTRSVEQPKDFGSDKGSVVRRWLAEIKAYEKQFANWVKRSDTITKRYRDDKESEQANQSRRFNILWSNVQTLGPAVYARPPKPDVTRRYSDRDPVGRAAAAILERSLSYTLDVYDFDATAKAVRDDYLLTARGQAWVRYVPRYGEETTDRIPLQQADDAYFDEDGRAVEGSLVQFDGETPYMDGEPYRPVLYEEVVCDHIAWRDFGHTPAPKWEKVTAVWKREQLTRDQLVERFGEKIGNEVSLQKTVSNVSKEAVAEHGDVFKRAEVYEIWDKTRKKAVWISPGYVEGPLDEKDDPLRLQGFFPCPRPLYGTMTTDTLVPVPDYIQYQSQANELDELTHRINLLVKALKVAGVYDASQGDALEGIIHGEDNKLIPVDSFAVLAEKGGIQGAISFLPIKEVAEVAAALTEARAQVKQDLYEISGISDIMRGQVDPREKLGQSRIKGQFGTLRLEDRKTEVARFLRDILRIKAEIIAEHFDPQNILEMSGWEQTEEARNMARMRQEVEQQARQAMQARMQGQEVELPAKLPPSPEQLFEQAMELLKQDRLRTFRIDVETDSTTFEDQAQEKETRVEFLTAAGGFIRESVVAAEKFPAVTPLLGEMLLFGIRGFKAGRRLEGIFEEAMEKLREAPAQPQEDPNAAQQQAEAEKTKAEQAVKGAELQQRQREAEAEAEVERAKLQAEQADSLREHQRKLTELDQKQQDLDRKWQEMLLSAQEQGALANAVEGLAERLSAIEHTGGS